MKNISSEQGLIIEDKVISTLFCNTQLSLGHLSKSPQSQTSSKTWKHGCFHLNLSYLVLYYGQNYDLILIKITIYFILTKSEVCIKISNWCLPVLTKQ